MSGILINLFRNHNAISSIVAIILVVFSIKMLKKNLYNHDEKNPFEGKKVKFVYDENDLVNADGVKGHLEAVGDSDYNASFYEKFIKKIIDFLLSFILILILLPIFLIISFVIIMDDPGKVFFSQKRIGKNKTYFNLHKFRTMKMSTPHDIPTHMLENPEQYITKVGKFLRKYSLDELPQLIDVFFGQMSFVGPRPALWNQDLLIGERDKYNANDVVPGITGWAQINGRDELTVEEKAKFDGEYVKNISFSFDIKCFFSTFMSVFKHEGVVEGKKDNSYK